MGELSFTINIQPRTKKTSQRIVMRGRYPKLLPSAEYVQYEKDSRWFIPKTVPEFNYPVNVKAVFYRQSKHRVDLVNLEQALCDILVKYGVLKDDSFKYICSMDGSRVDFDKDNPRTEITITEVTD